LLAAQHHLLPALSEDETRASEEGDDFLTFGKENFEVTKPDVTARTAAVVRTPAVLVGGLAALAIVVGVVLWLLLRGGGSGSSQRAPASAASIQRLNAFAASLQHPIYWAGPQPRFTYELSRTKDGRVYIRYLPPGVKPGSSKPDYLTIGTYPQRQAFATLRATARKQAVAAIHLPGGGLAFQDKTSPTSVYLAYPGSDYQIEVFDPTPARSRQLVASGQVKPVGAPPPTPAGSKAASVTELKALAVKLGHPIYWAGTQPAVKYEVTTTKDGSVYIRYLPQGARIGDRRPNYLTIGTYPQKGALAILKATAAKNHVETLRLDNGGLSFVDKKHPTSVYIAYPGVDLQIEVYDPAASRARQVVTSGQISPVR
jgi:hypothetical protein